MKRLLILLSLCAASSAISQVSYNGGNYVLSGGALNVPNTTGVTTVLPTSFSLSSTWLNGATLLLRWVDDNAVTPSPDQIIGLDNVTLSSAIGAFPTATLTAPSNGATFQAPATVSFAANASDTDGTITKVEFYNGVTKVGEDTTAPYAFDWTNVAAGTYSLTAIATDSDGNPAASAARSITVNPAPGSGTLTRGPLSAKGRPVAHDGSLAQRSDRLRPGALWHQRGQPRPDCG